ncbi:MAG: TolC family protein [Aquabacterium sp.]|uniref:TolC family protein n=1 Tax=Aquabacterium sp. TaxID=1872578 RepID=UPI0025C5C7A6|nr:TolC family protein [Aquabacterium sp.]MBI5926611.1 TolC family protein [Aquabacterium sp.]
MGFVFLDDDVSELKLVKHPGGRASSNRLNHLTDLAGVALVLVGLGGASRLCVAAGEVGPTGAIAMAERMDMRGMSLRLSPIVSMPPFAHGSSSQVDAENDPAALSWSEALTLVAQQSSLVRAAVAQAQAQGGVARQAWAQAYMPRLDLSAQWQHDELRTQYETTRKPSSSAGVQASVPLWHGADRATEQAQSALAERAIWQARLARMVAARDVSRSYLLAVEAAAQLELMREQQAILAAQLRVNEQRLKGGVGTSLDTLETATRLDQLQADLHDRQGQYESQRLALGRLLGQNVPQVASLNLHGVQDEDGGTLVVEPLNEALARVPDRSLPVQEAQALVRSARMDIEARRAETWHPSIDAVAGLNRARQITKSADSHDTLNYTERTLGVQLSMPLYSGGRQSARNQESAALLIKAEAERDDALARAQAELQDAYQRLTQYQRQVRALREVATTAQATLEALQRAFVAGYRSNLDLLNAQQQLIATRSQSVSARINVLLAQVDILSQTEQLDAATVAPLSARMSLSSPHHVMKDLP